jgi:hypothetical protein
MTNFSKTIIFIDYSALKSELYIYYFILIKEL